VIKQSSPTTKANDVKFASAAIFEQQIDWLRVSSASVIYKGRIPSNGRLSDFSFYIDSQKSANRKFKK
jgi:hypothetical protein